MEKIEELSYDELYDKYIRLFADFENYKKTSRKAIANAIDATENEIIRQFLPIIDDLTIGLKYGDDALHKIHRKLTNVLSSMGLERFGEVGDKFDDEKYNAVYTTDDPLIEDNTVSGILKHGYTYKGRIVRYADVSVNRIG